MDKNERLPVSSCSYSAIEVFAESYFEVFGVAYVKSLVFLTKQDINIKELYFHLLCAASRQTRQRLTLFFLYKRVPRQTRLPSSALG